MTIREYMDRNLPNLNWNILPQIFESEGVELTEEIERYLRETPKNTNWNVFNSVGSGATEVKKIILQISSGTIVSSDFNSAQEIYEYCENHKYTYEDDYGEVRVSAQGIEVYHEFEMYLKNHYCCINDNCNDCFTLRLRQRRTIRAR